MKKRCIALALALATCLPMSSAFAQTNNAKIESRYYSEYDEPFVLSPSSLKTMKTSSGTKVWNVTVKDFVKALNAFEDGYELEDLKKVKDKNVFYQEYRDITVYFYGTNSSYSKGYLKKVVVKCKRNTSERGSQFAGSVLGRLMLIFAQYDIDDALDILDGLELDYMDGKSAISTTKNTSKFKISYPSKTTFAITVTPK